MRSLLGIALAAAVTTHAYAAGYTVSQPFDEAGDISITDFPEDNYLPTFDPTLGTLTAVDVLVKGNITWEQSGLALAVDPSKPLVMEAFGQVNGLMATTGASFGETLPTLTHRYADYSYGFFPVFNVNGTISDDPAAFLDPSNPEDLQLGFSVGTLCISNCSDVSVVFEDAYGEFEGTISTTFLFTPTGVPEPMSVTLLGMGLLGLAATRRVFAVTENGDGKNLPERYAPWTFFQNN